MYEFLQPQESLPVPDPTPQAPAAVNVPQVLQQEGAQGPSQSGQGFFDKLRTDPKLAQSMLMVGTTLLSGPKPGQDPNGIWGNAIMAGALAHNMMNLNEQANNRQEAESAARVEESQTRTAQSKQKMEQDAELFPTLKEKYQEEVKSAKARGDLDRVKYLGELWRTNPERLQQEFDSKLATDRAQRGSLGASAAASMALAGDRKFETEQKRILADPKSTPEQKEAAQNALNHNKGPAGQAKDQIEMLYQQLRKIHPTKPEGDLRQKALDIQSSKKGDLLLHLQTLSEHPDLSKTERKRYLDAYKSHVQSLLGGDSGTGTGTVQPAPAEAERVHGQQYSIGGQTKTWYNDGKQKGWQ